MIVVKTKSTFNKLDLHLCQAHLNLEWLLSFALWGEVVLVVPLNLQLKQPLTIPDSH